MGRRFRDFGIATTGFADVHLMVNFRHLADYTDDWKPEVLGNARPALN